ncbi:MAG: type II toxin-antitoxin system HicA family toxin [Ignavibacteriales bacterium]
MSYTREVKKILKANGCWFVRQGRGDHEVWESPLNGKRFTVDGKIMSRHTANGTLEDAGLDKAF